LSIRVVIADDHPCLRKTLRVLLERQAAMQVIGEAMNGEEAVRCCQELMPDVATMDIRMPVMDGVAATQQIRSRCPSVRVLAVSSDVQPVFIEQMLAAGAQGYVLKDFLYEELSGAVTAIAQGRAFLGRLVVDQLLVGLGGLEPPLNAQELAVLGCLIEGMGEHQIAQDLVITRDVIERTLQSVRNKVAGYAIGELLNHVKIE
jgi:DNA-binding NarL/FixJ family response regulator